MVSVVIPLFNRDRLIQYTLESLSSVHHSGVDLEVIVVDDASNDLGPEIVGSGFPWVKLIRNNFNKGAAACRNQGLSLANGEFILFLDSDDLIEPNYFVDRIDILKKNEQYSGVYGPWVFFRSEENFMDDFVEPRKSAYPIIDYPSRDSIMEKLLGGWYIHPSAILWRTTIVKKIGGNNVDLKIQQDVDLCFRMILEGDLVGIKGPRALARIHGGDRVGTISSSEKLREILNLGKRNILELKARKIWKPLYGSVMALYFFNLWAKYRKIYPNVAKDILLFSKSLDPSFRMDGTILLRLLSYLFGNELATKIKQSLKGV